MSKNKTGRHCAALRDLYAKNNRFGNAYVVGNMNASFAWGIHPDHDVAVVSGDTCGNCEKTFTSTEAPRALLDLLYPTVFNTVVITEYKLCDTCHKSAVFCGLWGLPRVAADVRRNVQEGYTE